MYFLCEPIYEWSRLSLHAGTDALQNVQACETSNLTSLLRKLDDVGDRVGPDVDSEDCQLGYTHAYFLEDAPRVRLALYKCHQLISELLVVDALCHFVVQNLHPDHLSPGIILLQHFN